MEALHDAIGPRSPDTGRAVLDTLERQKQLSGAIAQPQNFVPLSESAVAISGQSGLGFHGTAFLGGGPSAPSAGLELGRCDVERRTPSTTTGRDDQELRRPDAGDACYAGAGPGRKPH